VEREGLMDKEVQSFNSRLQQYEKVVKEQQLGK
jgi:hypothetical protein